MGDIHFHAVSYGRITRGLENVILTHIKLGFLTHGFSDCFLQSENFFFFTTFQRDQFPGFLRINPASVIYSRLQCRLDGVVLRDFQRMFIEKIPDCHSIRAIDEIHPVQTQKNFLVFRSIESALIIPVGKIGKTPKSS